MSYTFGDFIQSLVHRLNFRSAVFPHLRWHELGGIDVPLVLAFFLHGPLLWHLVINLINIILRAYCCKGTVTTRGRLSGFKSQPFRSNPHPKIRGGPRNFRFREKFRIRD